VRSKAADRIGRPHRTVFLFAVRHRVKARCQGKESRQGCFGSGVATDPARGCPPHGFFSPGRTRESVRPPEATTRANVRFHSRSHPHLFPAPNAASCQDPMCGASILKNRTRNFRPLNATKTNGRAPKRRGRPNSQAPLSERLLHPFGRERCMAHPHAGELHHRI
jgi:hypothetical protein